MLFSWTFISCFLQIPILVCSYTSSECLVRMNYRIHGEGNVVIIGYFPAYAIYPLNKTTDWRMLKFNRDFMVEIKLKNYQCILAMMFAIEEINNNPYLLPNTSLGFEVNNISQGQRYTLANVFRSLSTSACVDLNYRNAHESNFAAVLTGPSWAISEYIGTLLDLYKFPQLTFGPFDSLQSEQRRFSSLYQVAPKDTFLTLGIVSLMLHFHWIWVGLFIIDDDKGAQTLSDLRSEMDKNGVCTAFVEMIVVTRGSFFTKSWKNQVQILESSSNVIIIHGDSDSLLSLIVNIKQKLLTWKVWVLISQWDVSKFDDYFMVDSLHGALIFSHHREDIPNFTDFMQKSNPSKYPEDTYLHVLWHIFFNCSFVNTDCKIVHNCLPNASLGFLPGNIFDMAMSEESYNVYNAVYAVAHSLHEMILNQVQFQTHEKGKKMVFFPWQLHPYLRKTLFNQDEVNEVLDWKRKSHVEYDILNFWNFPKGLGLNVKVGTFSPSAPKNQKLSISSNMIQWATGPAEIPQSVCSESCHPGFRKMHKEGIVACCFDCTPCPENEISNETDMDQCVKCPESHYGDTDKIHCLQKTVTFLAYGDPWGKTLCFLSLGFSSLTAAVLGVFLKNRDTPIVKANNLPLSYTLLITLMLCFLCPLLFIGHPSTASCILQQNIFGLLFTMALSTVLAKSITVVLAFKITAAGRIRRWLLISRAPNFIIPLCTLLQVFLSAIWLTTSPPFVDKDAHSEHGHIIIICNKGSAIAFHCTLGYLGALALASYFMAFLSRNLPDTFNEAKFLAFSMLVFCSVWVTFLPVYHSTKGKVTVAMEVFSILASSTSLLGIIFVPKCYLILLRPERNSLNYIREKSYARRKKP
ncbi:vomeronasal 2 receptor 25 precursor [Rattus norvegicus]|uniref:Vomeronasal 2 receptor, 25 n=1 Tax=Rattus norvegicus TaxID=10116 RepID=A0ABK0LVL2_RAT|nr:vomeronasal 2 receptor 25 precursor [Rattus norvegicus]|eukprot:NP_001092952.1 vomeronasal 2 receptor 25 precursor [Rattus norvegicus]